MSKIKSATEKKRISLERDRRNIYGECPTSSRKNIRLGKQRSHMEQRRAVSETLRSLKGTMQSFDTDEIESQAKARLADLQRHAFKKKPDAPLGVVIERKTVKRLKNTERNK
ncbi:MAG TPA: hypothetical protein VGG46_03015 [Terriglobales bacterium]